MFGRGMWELDILIGNMEHNGQEKVRWANKGRVCFHSINWLPFAAFCTVMCETPSWLIILHKAAGTLYWDKGRFSQ